MSHPPTYTLLPHFHKIEACSSPLDVRAGRRLQQSNPRGQSRGRTRPGLTLPGSTAAYPSGSSFYLPSSSFHKNYFRKLFTNSFSVLNFWYCSILNLPKWLCPRMLLLQQRTQQNTRLSIKRLKSFRYCLKMKYIMLAGKAVRIVVIV